MERIIPKHSPELAVYPKGHLSRAYSPGDDICGTVTRFAKLISPKATLIVVLRGQSIISGHRTGEIIGGKFCFFTNGHHSVQRVLVDGPVHVEEGLRDGSNWDFRIQLPKTTGLSTKRYSRASKYSFLPIEPEEIPKHQLPPTFESPDGLTEYYLEAILRYTIQGKHEYVNAIAPLHVRTESLPYAIDDFELKEKRFKLDLRRYTLLPGVSRDQLSLKQKAKSLFSAAGVPSVRLLVDLSMPRIIQLGHPDCLPVMLQITKEAAGTSESLYDLPLKVTITSIRIICREIGSSHSSTFRTNNPRNLGLERVFDALLTALELDVGSGPAEVDIGAKLKLRLQAAGLYSGKTRLAGLSPRLTPCFVCYNIQLRHEFKYILSLEVGGEKAEFEDQFEVTLLPEPEFVSASAPSPPPDIDAAGPSREPPPSFADVVEEDQLAGRATGAGITPLMKPTGE